jgi:replicative DNA helicase
MARSKKRTENITPVSSMTSIIEGKLPPQNVEAEQAVLGSLLINKDAIYNIVDFLNAEDFYKPIHTEIYTSILDIFEKKEPIDILSLSNRLREKKKLEEVGGMAYLTDLVNSVPTAAHVAQHAQIVNKKSLLRNLISAAHDISLMGYQETEDIDVILDQAESRIFNIAQKTVGREFSPIKEALNEAWERIDRLHKGEGAMRGVPTGFKDLDNYLSGLQKADLVVLASRPSLGKTSLALDIARYVATKEKLPVGFFSLEMSNEQVVDRLIAAEANVELWRMRTGKLATDSPTSDFDRISQALTTLSDASIYIDDTAMANVMHMRAMARRLQAQHGLALLVVDYLQLMQPRITSDSMVQQVTEISRSLKALAKELNVPVLAISQLNRAVEQREQRIPRLSDLRESGSIEQDADVVMFIYRKDRVNPDIEEKNVADIIIAKHRNGPIGQVKLYFDEQKASFRSLEKNLDDIDF